MSGSQVRSTPFEGTAMQNWFVVICSALLVLLASFGHAGGEPPGFEEQAQGAGPLRTKSPTGC